MLLDSIPDTLTLKVQSKLAGIEMRVYEINSKKLQPDEQTNVPYFEKSASPTIS